MTNKEFQFLIRKKFISLGRSLLRNITTPRKKAVIEYPLAVSFVTGYKESREEAMDICNTVPCLWEVSEKVNKIHKYPFPRMVQDFREIEVPIIGQMPDESLQDFEILPRFGLTGLTQDDDRLYAGSWNGVYMIRKKDFFLEGILSHKLICDTHGICLGNDMIITLLTCKDTVVLSSKEGELIDHFTVKADLSLERDDTLLDVDWRFISKQKRGSVGLFHFNYAKKYGDELYLTSRNLSCFVVIDLKKRVARLRPVSFKYPNLIHDGLLHDNKFYFTSIDGQVHITKEGDPNSLYTSDLQEENIKLKRFPNWTRGLEVVGDSIYVTIDGRYGADLGFGIQKIDMKGKYMGEIKIDISKIEYPSLISYMTGFDIIGLS